MLHCEPGLYDYVHDVILLHHFTTLYVYISAVCFTMFVALGVYCNCETFLCPLAKPNKVGKWPFKWFHERVQKN